MTTSSPRRRAPRFRMSVAAVGLTAVLVAAPRGATRAADPQPYTVEIAPTGDAALDGAIHDSATLIGLRESAPVGPFALIGRARADRDRILAALHSYGFYKGTVNATIGGQPLDAVDLPDRLDALPKDPPVKVDITPVAGPQFHLRHVTLDGAVPAAARDKLDLAEGAPARAADVVGAQGRLLDALREGGYALATVSDPDARLSPDADALDVTFTVVPGPRVNIGPVAVEGLTDIDESYVRRRLLLHQGEQYAPSTIEAARQDLANTGVFSTVRAVPATTLDPRGELPVTFDVDERPKRAVNFTAAYSTDLGASLGASWQHRNLFGEAEQLTLSAAVTGGGSAERNPGYNISAQFVKPDFPVRDESVQLDLGAVKEDLVAYNRKAITGDALFNVKFDKEWSGSIGVAGEQERIYQEFVTRDYTLVGLPATVKYDSTDNLFAPTEGIRASANVTPTESLGKQDATFVILQASASTYIDISSLWGDSKGRSIVATRGLIGDAEGAGQFGLPPDKRFYAGGSATVRGYRYQQVGPLFADNRPQGGTGVAAASIEYRQRILSSFGVVGFVDVGQVTANGPPLGGVWAAGAGIGARYYTAIGPIRVDVAVPLQKVPGNDTLELYIGIGEAF